MKTIDFIEDRQHGIALSLTRRLRELVIKKLGSLDHGQILVHDPWGVWTSGTRHDGLRINIEVRDPAFYLHLLFNGSNGVAGSYMRGEWTCSDLTGLFRLLLLNTDLMDGLETGASNISNIIYKVLHFINRNSLRGSRQNIHAHYDLGNEFFELFLDDTMTYSCGIYVDGNPTLREASIEKLDRICRKLGLDDSMNILEIGSGWGSFALHAARHYGCHVTAVTISRQQYEYASARIRKAGLEDRIDLRLQDYREISGKYDRIVSIEMLEAVGHRYLPVYFSRCSDLLQEDGQLLVQVITMPDHRYKKYLKQSDFIQQYIFPGSCCPSLNAISSAATTSSDLRITHLEDIGEHYAQTLRNWCGNFRASETEILSLGYDPEFIRLWEYYFCYCEAGFRERYTGNLQIVFDKPGCRSTVVF